MKLVVVNFNAYDKANTMYFLDKTYEEIHNTLSTICETYVVTNIIEATGANFQPLNYLNKFKK